MSESTNTLRFLEARSSFEDSSDDLRVPVRALDGLRGVLMRLLGDANAWMPKWTGAVLRIPPREPAAEIVPPDIAPQTA